MNEYKPFYVRLSLKNTCVIRFVCMKTGRILLNESGFNIFMKP